MDKRKYSFGDDNDLINHGFGYKEDNSYGLLFVYYGLINIKVFRKYSPLYMIFLLYKQKNGEKI